MWEVRSDWARRSLWHWKQVSITVGLGQLEPRRGLAHHGVAVGAGDVAGLVGRAAPIGLVALLVAAQAHRIGVGHRGALVGLAERADMAGAAAAAAIDVRGAGPVAAFALHLALGRHLAGLDVAAHDGLFELVEQAGVAGLARLGADIVALLRIVRRRAHHRRLRPGGGGLGLRGLGRGRLGGRRLVGRRRGPRRLGNHQRLAAGRRRLGRRGRRLRGRLRGTCQVRRRACQFVAVGPGASGGGCRDRQPDVARIIGQGSVFLRAYKVGGGFLNVSWLRPARVRVENAKYSCRCDQDGY